MAKPETGDKAPEFTLTSHDMKQVSLAEEVAGENIATHTIF